MKKFISIFLVLMMLAGVLSSCSIFGDKNEESESQSESQSQNESESQSDSESQSESESESQGGDEGDTPLVGTTYFLNNTASFVKLLDPRMEKTADYITCDWSASGIEFVATCKGDVVFKVNAATKMGGGVEGCYFRVYVDGAEYKNGDTPYYTVKGDSTLTVAGLTEGTHTIKLVKATGYTLANVNLISVTLDGTVSGTAPADKEFFIEYVGDSMSCGWGVVGNYDGAYTAQDAALAYPYLVSEALGADMSVVALSGQGIIKGNPGIANGYKYASPFRSKAAEYSFTRKPDVIVINADTNDGYENTAVATYISSFGNFVNYVREKNPDAHILVVCNMMRTNYTTALEDYVYNTLGGDDNNYYYYKAAETADVHSNHPSKEEHEAYALALTALIDSILKGTYDDGGESTEKEEYTPNAPTTTLPTDYETVYEQNFDSATTAESVGITSLYNGNINPDFSDGKLNISSEIGWADCRAVLVPNSAFADYASKYLVEMDVTIGEKLGVFGLLLNTGGSSVWASDKANSFLVTLRRGDFVNGDLLADKNISFRAGYFTADGTQTTPTDNDKVAFDVTEDGQASFRLSIVVNQNRIDLFIDGVWVHGYDIPRGVDTSLKRDSAIILWSQSSDVSIDNLVVKIDESTKGSVEVNDNTFVPETVIPTNTTVIYSQNFDNASTAADAGVTPLYGSTLSPTIVDGKLSVSKTGWTKPPFLSLVDRSVFVDKPDAYVIEMDVNMTNHLGVFGLILNGSTPAESDTKYGRANAFLVTLRLGKGVDQLTHGTFEEKAGDYDIYLRTGYFGADAAQVTDLENDKLVLDLQKGDTGANVKLTVVVYSNTASGSTVHVFANGQFIYGYDMGDSFDVNENSYVSLWAQDAEFTIDNLVVSTF